MKKFHLILFLTIFLVGFTTAATYSDICYFNAYSAGESWSNNPSNMVDGSTATFTSTITNNDVQLLTTNNCSGTGTIDSVEIRAHGYYSTDDLVTLRPVFTNGDGDDHLDAVPAITANYGPWFDITSDTNAPTTWTFTDIQNLDTDVVYIKTGGGQLSYVSIVEIRVNYTSNTAPTISNITASHTIITGGGTITIYANTTSNGVNDSEGDSLTIYCSDSTAEPTTINNSCANTDSSYPYELTCLYNVRQTTGNDTVFCRIYDGTDYSLAVNTSYEIDSTPPSLSIVSVAGDTTASYFDTVNDGITSVNISGEAGMTCRWSSSDVSYTLMSSSCVVSGIYAECNFTDVGSQALTSRYIACIDSLGASNNATNNLDVTFTLDYTAPTTSDNSDTGIHVPTYTITITEADNTDGNPDTFYCTDTIGNCTPSLSINDGGTISFTTANRGQNYLRYYSIDDAGNTQTTTNKSIRINRLPIFTSASDNATIVGPSDTINITTVSSELDSGQTLTLYVCDSNSATSSGCGGTQYCNSTEDENLTCIFNAETSSGTYNWYAFLYDELDESSTSNFSGTYDVDAVGPIVTIILPENDTYSPSLTATITLNEAGVWAGYSLDSTENITMSSVSSTEWTSLLSDLSEGLHNITFYANDSYGNMGISEIRYFTISSDADTILPLITIWSPLENFYDLDGAVLLNITTNENLTWAGWSNDSGLTSYDLENISMTSWNSTITFIEGRHDLIFYANDTAGNQGTKNRTFYVDLTNPSVDSLSCNSTIADSEDIVCNSSISDAIGLSHGIISWNSTGTFQNSSNISLTEISDELEYMILSGNTTPGTFMVSLFLYDDSGRLNDTSNTTISVTDDTKPSILNISYSPNTTAELDPDVQINITATILEDHNISVVYLMYKNSTATSWTYIQMDNSSVLTLLDSSEVIYNASFMPTTENYTFRINATDSAGNQNISSNYTLVVENDTSANITTTVLDTISIVYSERADNNTLGYLILNNTGETEIQFNVSLISTDLALRLFVNATTDSTGNYTISSGEIVNISLEVNTTGLTEGLKDYNISVVSNLGTTTLEKKLNIQIAAGPYLVTTIDTYSSSVNRGETDLTLVASVKNYGTSDATGVYLNWTLPTGFTLSSGTLNKNVGNLGVWADGIHEIKVNAGSSISETALTLIASSSSTNAATSNDSKNITITDPMIITDIVTTSGGGGGGGGGGGVQQIVYSKIIEVVRGEKDSFEIEIENINPNATLKDLTIEITGFLAQYIEVSPKKLSSIGPKDKGIFIVTLKAPAYKESYEEYTLRVVITGTLSGETIIQSYTEIQNIKLIIQEISREESNFSLFEAEKAIQEMKESGFSTEKLEIFFEQAREKLSDNKNKESHDLSQEILRIRDKAFEVDSLINRILEVFENPRKISFLTGKAISIDSLRPIVIDSSFRNSLDLAIIAFERGDYDLAEERAVQVKNLLILESRSNLIIFFYLYWHFILLGIFLFVILSYIVYKIYQKESISKKILYLDFEEKKIQKLMCSAQEMYFKKKIAEHSYHSLIAYHTKKIAFIRKERIRLRNKRIKILSPERIELELEKERKIVVNELKKVQKDFYMHKNISQTTYESQFGILSERMAEIEEERMTLKILEERK